MSNYRQLRSAVCDGDILLFRGSGDPMARLINRFTKSPYAHAALAFWWGDRLLCYESVPAGVRPINLSHRVSRLSAAAAIDVYRAPNIDAEHVRHAALQFAGHGYDFAGIGRFARAVLLKSPPRGDSNRLFCSELIARAMGIDGNANFIAPGDLAKVADFQFAITR